MTLQILSVGLFLSVDEQKLASLNRTTTYTNIKVTYTPTVDDLSKQYDEDNKKWFQSMCFRNMFCIFSSSVPMNLFQV